MALDWQRRNSYITQTNGFGCHDTFNDTLFILFTNFIFMGNIWLRVFLIDFGCLFTFIS